MNIITVPFNLRVSIIPTCNLACMYCPRYTSMENYTPNNYKNRGLSTKEFSSIISNLLKGVKFNSVSITGGEPFMNSDIDKIIKEIRPFANKLELNTNGTMVNYKKWEEIAPLIDVVKISLDTIDYDLYNEMTETKDKNALNNVIKFIDNAKGLNKQVVVNCVVSKKNYKHLYELVDFAQKKQISIHLLDFYYSDEKKDVWEENFLPIEVIQPYLNERYGELKEENLYGCTFYQYDINENTCIRLKSSYGKTMRSEKCKSCSDFCQEGLYAMKLSREGWVTACPSDSQDSGELLDVDMSPNQIVKKISRILNELVEAKSIDNTFTELLTRHGLDIDNKVHII